MRKNVFIFSAILGIAAIAGLFVLTRDKGSDTDLYEQHGVHGVTADGMEFQRPDEQEDTRFSEPVMIMMDETEKSLIQRQVEETVRGCLDIYEKADKGVASNIVLSDKSMHEIVDCIARKGYTSACGGDDYNMQNAEALDGALRRAAENESVKAEFYTITKSGVFEWRKLEFSEGSLTMTYAGAVLEKEGEPHISYMEKVKMYGWHYTDKGWLVMEKAKSRNHEMDMHSMFRVLPLSDECREYCSKYIEPVGYMGNNLFLTDWGADTLDRVVLNDVFELLYAMEYGKSYEGALYPDGVPKELYESVITAYFPISGEELEALPGYQQDTHTYAWKAMGVGTVIPQIQPFPEVVEVKHQEDGSVRLVVDAIYVEEGSDHGFTHEVTLGADNSGKLKYIGNHIVESENNRIPGYMPRGVQTRENTDVLGKMISSAKSYQNLYDKLSDNKVAVSDNQTAVDLETEEKILSNLGKEGYSAVDWDNQLDMQNFEKLENFCKKGMGGEKGSTEIIRLLPDGGFIWYELSTYQKELEVERYALTWDKAACPKAVYLDTFTAETWSYTQKGYLLFEKYQPPGYDGGSEHYAVRVRPLDKKCREFNQKYILPIGYSDNNLFLADWQEGSFGELCFEDLYGKLYPMKYGTSPKAAVTIVEIPDEDYEAVIQSYLRIGKEELRNLAGFDATARSYPWRERGMYEFPGFILPCPEVTSYKENEDGSITLTVEAVWADENTDCAFVHEVTVLPQDNKHFFYLSNHILSQKTQKIPKYVERRKE